MPDGPSRFHWQRAVLTVLAITVRARDHPG